MTNSKQQQNLVYMINFHNITQQKNVQEMSWEMYTPIQIV